MIQGMASKACSTHNNRKHIFFIFGACMPGFKFQGVYPRKNLVVRTPCFSASYPQGVRVTPVKNHWHITSWNFAKTLVWKQEYDVKLWRHKQRTPNTNDHRMALNETPRHENFLPTPLHIRPAGRRHVTKSGTIILYFHGNFLPTDNVSEGKAVLYNTYSVNRTSFCYLEIETCPVDIPVDFYVTGISPRNLKKAAKLKLTDFRVNFLLCLLFGPADSTNWWCFKWIKQWYIFLMSWKLNNKIFFHWNLFVWNKHPNRCGISHMFFLWKNVLTIRIVCKDRPKSLLLSLLFFVVRNLGLQIAGPEPSPESHQ